MPVTLEFDKGQNQLWFKQAEFLQISENCHVPEWSWTHALAFLSLRLLETIPQLEHTKEAMVEKIVVTKSHWT